MGNRGNSALRRTYWDGRAYKTNKIYQPDHQFKFGDVVRWDSVAKKYVLASASDGESAEALGIVTVSGNENPNHSTLEYRQRAHPSPRDGTHYSDYFSVVHRGEITIPYKDEVEWQSNDFLFDYVPGEVYFLNPRKDGTLTRTRPSTFSGDVIKPMLVALDEYRAVVVNYIGRQMLSDGEAGVSGPENISARFNEFQNVGDIQAYLGTYDNTSEFLYCDGRLLNADLYPELFEVIEDRVLVTASSQKVSGKFRLTFTSDVSGAIAGGMLAVRTPGSTTVHACTVNKKLSASILEVVPDDDSDFPGHGGSATDVEVQGHSQYMKRQFFIPDYRNKVLFGGLTDSENFGLVGGSSQTTLGSGTDISTGSNKSSTVDNLQSNMSVNFYIRYAESTCASQMLTCCDNTSSIEDYRNKILNGDFQVWQRGSEFPFGFTDTATFTNDLVDTCKSQYTADRWFRAFQSPCQMKGGVRRLDFGTGAGQNPISQAIRHFAQVGGWTNGLTERNGLILTHTDSSSEPRGDCCFQVGECCIGGGTCCPEEGCTLSQFEQTYCLKPKGFSVEPLTCCELHIVSLVDPIS